MAEWTEEMEIVEPDEEGDIDYEDDSVDNKTNNKKSVYLPSKTLKENEELVCDDSAYHMLHQAQTGAPCLSFDIIRDCYGDNRETYPMISYMVCGTQAARAHVNNVIVMKMFNLHRTSREKETESESDDELEDDEDVGERDDSEKLPKMSCALIKHQGCVNRIRATVLNSTTNIAATWSELGRVNIFNIDAQLQAIEDENMLKTYEKKNSEIKPLYTFNGHLQEGYALDWNQCSQGILATGDCRSFIHVWHPTEAGSWTVNQIPLKGHSASVEDIQWSPNEPSVMASCSVDRSLRIWDIRASPEKACMLTVEDAHENDVNVISWNRNEPFIVSGGDDGFLRIWDLRQLQSKQPVAIFKHHTNSVTTVEWHPTDSTVFASGGSDDQIALWDLALEKDDEGLENKNLENNDELDKLPPQLLFIHQGQEDIKELHWHPQIPGVILSTANSGFNIFRTISV